MTIKIVSAKDFCAARHKAHAPSGMAALAGANAAARPAWAGSEQAEQVPAGAAPAQESARTGKPEGGMAARIDKREGALLRLEWSEIKLAAVYRNEGLVTARDRKTSRLRAVLRDSIILNLYNFLKARRDLISDPHYKDLDDALWPLIGPILDVETPITKLRDRYIAHAQEHGRPFRGSIQDIVDKHMLDMHYGYWLSLARSAASYAMFIQANYADVMTKAERKYDEKLPLPLRYGHGNSTRYKNTHVKAVNEAAGRLLSRWYKVMPREARIPIARRWQS